MITKNFDASGWDVEFGTSFTRIYKAYPEYTFHVSEALSEDTVSRIIHFHNRAFEAALTAGQEMKAKQIKQALMLGD